MARVVKVQYFSEPPVTPAGSCGLVKKWNTDLGSGAWRLVLQITPDRPSIIYSKTAVKGCIMCHHWWWCGVWSTRWLGEHMRTDKCPNFIVLNKQSVRFDEMSLQRENKLGKLKRHASRVSFGSKRFGPINQPRDQLSHPFFFFCLHF